MTSLAVNYKDILYFQNCNNFFCFLEIEEIVNDQSPKMKHQNLELVVDRDIGQNLRQQSNHYHQQNITFKIKIS